MGLVLAVMTRGIKKRYERGCLAYLSVGYVKRKLFILHLPQEDVGQVASLRLGMFLPHRVGTHAKPQPCLISEQGGRTPESGVWGEFSIIAPWAT